MVSLPKGVGDLQEEGRRGELLGREQNTAEDAFRVRTGPASPHFASFPHTVQHEQQGYAGQYEPYAQRTAVSQRPYGYGSPTQPPFQHTQAQISSPSYSQHPARHTHDCSLIFTDQGYQQYAQQQQQQYSQGAPFSATYARAPGRAFPVSPRLARAPVTSTPQKAASTTPRRRSDHPDPPADRSEWVMWVGNVPNDATSEELQRFFTDSTGAGATNTPWEQDGSGVLSIFPITRSNCAFVNYMTEAHLHAAIGQFNGAPFRAGGRYAPLVCRLRGRDDDLRAGVGVQRGVGMHRGWVKAQQKQKQKEGKGKVTADALTPPPPVSLSPSLSPPNSSSSDSANASTSSSLLENNFPDRYFILKSHTQEDLDQSLRRGIWATQKHNERIFDRAFRTSKNVYFIFSVNKSGEFYGYARMSGPLNADPDTRVQWARHDTLNPHAGTSQAEQPPPQISRSEHLVRDSPSAASTPGAEPELHTHSMPPVMNDGIRGPNFAAPALELSPGAYAVEQPMMRPRGPSVRPFSTRAPLSRENVIIDKDKEKSPEKGRGNDKENEDRARDGLSKNFPLQWLCAARLPFGRTRHIRNPWNHGREVKVSRDGTELEPSVGRALVAAWGDTGLGA